MTTMRATPRITDEASAIAYLESIGRHISDSTRTTGAVEIDLSCPKCGGSGFGNWRQDGGRCYACGGANTKGMTKRVSVKTYAQRIKREQSAATRRDRQRWLGRFDALRDFVRETSSQLLTDLRADHPIVRDIRAKVIQWGSITENQSELVSRLAADSRQKGGG